MKVERLLGNLTRNKNFQWKIMQGMGGDFGGARGGGGTSVVNQFKKLEKN